MTDAPHQLSAGQDATDRTDDAHYYPVSNAQPVNAEKRRPLYVNREKVYPKLVQGRFRLAKWAILVVTLSIYYLTPWIRWDRGPNAPDQAVLLDIPDRKFYFFWIEVWPQEIYFLTGLLVFGALLLFLITSMFGRVWCGYTCPQTVWADLFIHIERWIEGDRNKRIKLDNAPWNAGKIGKKLSKHAIWLIIAVATGGAWVFYFSDAPELAGELIRFDASTPAYVFIGLFTFTTYMLGGIAREQVCIYMCPWPRIQGAMFDEDSLLVSYRADRGEPRGPHKKGDPWEGRGDCIDCNQCVAACPMGIDIRDGEQLECIQCALCIDACNTIMDRVGRPRNLIAYETLNAPEQRARGEQQRPRLIRPRTIVYAATILVVVGVMAAGFALRSDLDVNLLRDRNPLFVTLADGSVRNDFTLKIMNKAHEQRQFELSIDGLDPVTIERQDGSENRLISVPPDALRSVRLFVSLPGQRARQTDLADGSAKVTFVLTDTVSGRMWREDTTFRVPER